MEFFSGYSIGAGTLEWWFGHFGRNNFSAVAWLQLVHSFTVILAAIPAGIGVIWRFRNDWIKPALLIAALSGGFFLILLLLSIAHSAEIGIALGAPFWISGLVDVVKVGGLFLATVFALSHWQPPSILPTSNRRG
jgi:hypothetical protein